MTKRFTANANTEKSRQQCRSGIAPYPSYVAKACDNNTQTIPNNMALWQRLATCRRNQQPCSPESCHSVTLEKSQKRSLQQSHFRDRKHIIPLRRLLSCSLPLELSVRRFYRQLQELFTLFAGPLTMLAGFNVHVLVVPSLFASLFFLLAKRYLAGDLRVVAALVCFPCWFDDLPC